MSKLINIMDLVQPHLRCNNCEDLFTGKKIFSCASGHTMCSLCLEEAYQERGRGKVRKRRTIYLNGTYHPRLKCKVKDCNKFGVTEQGGNLAALVRDLGLEVPCKNRKAGCGERTAEGEMEEHEDECGYRKVS